MSEIERDIWKVHDQRLSAHCTEMTVHSVGRMMDFTMACSTKWYHIKNMLLRVTIWMMIVPGLIFTARICTFMVRCFFNDTSMNGVRYFVSGKIFYLVIFPIFFHIVKMVKLMLFGPFRFCIFSFFALPISFLGSFISIRQSIFSIACFPVVNFSHAPMVPNAF